MATDSVGSKGRRLALNVVHTMSQEIVFGDADDTLVVGTLPPFASVVGGGVHIVTAFDSATSDTLDVGFKDGTATDDPNGYATLLDLTAVGWIELDELAATTNIMEVATDLTVTCTYNSTGTAPTAGRAFLTVHFVIVNQG